MNTSVSYLTSPSSRRAPMRAGFTLIELLVVLAIMATLLSIAAPRYFGGIDAAHESVLRENLYSLRDTLDKYYADHGQYPATLDDLVAQRYLRQVPIDPITGSNKSWKTIAPSDPGAGGVMDVQSTAPGTARDGTPYTAW